MKGQHPFASAAVGELVGKNTLQCNDFAVWPGAGSNRRPSDFQCLRPYKRDSLESLVFNEYRHLATLTDTLEIAKKGQKKGQK